MEHEDKNMKLTISPNPQGILRVMAVAVLASLTLFLLIQAKVSFKDIGRDPLSPHTISVSAEEKRVAKPEDIVALVSFTIHRENAALTVARDDVSASSAKVVGYLKGQGVEEKDIKATSYNMYPQEKDNGGCTCAPGVDCRCLPRITIKTFVVEETFLVKVRKLESAGEVIAGVSREGVNQISSLQFIVDDVAAERLKKEAREAAIAKAREEAKTLAKSLGVRLKGLVNFNEYGGPIYYEKYGRGGDLATGASATPPVPTIAPGENEISANVTLIYEVR